MVEFVAVLAAKLAVALIESDGFMVVTHHVFDWITRVLLR